MTEERLQKVLARAGFGSRRACEELVAHGRVRVNGERASLGRRVDATRDVVEVDGVRVEVAEEVVYLALHKPAGVVTTAHDPQGRPTVLDLVPRHPRVFPVGRLDRETSGLLLLTNDGDFALRMTHPRFGVPKIYVAGVEGAVTRKHIAALRRGVRLEDGYAKAVHVKVIAAKPGRTVVEIGVLEGRNRMVRRLLAEVGLPVSTLARTAIGPVRLGRLKEGDHRALSRVEVVELIQSAGAGDKPRTPDPEPEPVRPAAPRRPAARKKTTARRRIRD